MSLHALRAAQEVLPHGELHVGGDVGRCVAYLHRRLQETHGAHGVLHLLCRHGDRRLLGGAGQQGGWRRLLLLLLLLKRAALWSAGRGEGRAREVGLGPPRHPAQLPGDERKKAQQSQAADHKHSEQEAKSSVWWRATGTRDDGSHNMDKQMVTTRVREEEKEGDILLEQGFENGPVLNQWFLYKTESRALWEMCFINIKATSISL